jgi:hypothetical protein
VQDVESKAISAINEAHMKSNVLEEARKNTTSSHEANVESTKAEANSKHDQVLEQEKQRLTLELKRSLAQTVEHTKGAIDANNQKHQEQLALEQAKLMQVKAGFEKYKAETEEKLNQAAVQNLSLQDSIDDLQEKLDLCRAHRNNPACGDPWRMDSPACMLRAKDPSAQISNDIM